MEGVILKRDSTDWNNAWEWLKNHEVNSGLENPKEALNKGEVWQYMGSYLNDGVLLTSFRHREHPKTNDVYNCTYKHVAYDENFFEIRKPIK